MHFAKEFKKKYKIDTMSRPKQRLRLTTECEKLKKVLSTVIVNQTLSIECFADDKDVSGATNRCVPLHCSLWPGESPSSALVPNISRIYFVSGKCLLRCVKTLLIE